MVSNYTKIKRKALLLILVLVIVLTSLRLYQDLQTHNEHLKNNVVTQNRYIKALFKNEINEISQYYKNRAYSIIENKDIIKALKDKDREKLLQITMPIFYNLKNENKLFTRMHFHDSNHTSFLRLHKPSKYGDNLEKIRPMITYVQHSKEASFGMEIGVFDYDALTYRVVVPIFDNIEFLGVLELGINARYIIQHVNKAIEFENEVDRVKTMFLIKTELLKNQDKDISRTQIEDYSLVYKSELFESLAQDIKLNENYENIVLNDKVYSISSDNLILKDYLGKEAGRVIVAFDISDLKHSFNQIVTRSIIIAMIAMIIFILALNYAFNYFINKIEQSNMEIESILENSALGIIYVKNKKIVKVNNSFCSTFGYSKSELIGNTTHQIHVSDESYKSFYMNQRSLLAKRSSIKVEYKLKKRDGTIIWCQMSGKAINNQDIEGGIIWVIDDITRKKELTKQLEFNERYLKTIMDAQNNIIVIADGNKIVDANKAFFEFFGYKSLSEFLENNRCICDFFTGDKNKFIQKEKEKKWIDIVLEEPNKTHTACILDKNKNEHYFAIEINHFKLHSNIRNVAVFTDITQIYKYQDNLEHKVEDETQKRLDQERLLIRQSKMAAMGEMIDAIAHQWKQPLATMSLYAMDLSFSAQLGTLDEAKAIDLETKLKQQIEHLTATLDEFRSFFRPDKSKDNFYINEACSEAIFLMSHELTKNKIDVNIECNEELSLYGVKNEFKHIILNLLSNSKDAFNENNIDKREVSINVSQNQDSIKLEIKDNAGGIKEHLIDSIFNANVTTKENIGGTGIGLYMTKTIIENMQGDIKVKNIDSGAIFTIEFRQ
jgi:PAS domain S-box-containing protein